MEVSGKTENLCVFSATLRLLWPGFSQKDERGDFGLEQAKRLSFETGRFFTKERGKKASYEEEICP